MGDVKIPIMSGGGLIDDALSELEISDFVEVELTTDSGYNILHGDYPTILDTNTPKLAILYSDSNLLGIGLYKPTGIGTRFSHYYVNSDGEMAVTGVLDANLKNNGGKIVVSTSGTIIFSGSATHKIKIFF